MALATTACSSQQCEIPAAAAVGNRLQRRIAAVVANRSYSTCWVLEGLDDLANISAVLRSADAFGFQSVHIVTTSSSVHATSVKRYTGVRRAAQRGAWRWLDVEVWHSTVHCIRALKSRGYRIAVSSVGQGVVSVCKVDWTIPTAVLLGNEHGGASDYALSVADVLCGIPMVGMVDSLNVAVAAGVLMHHVMHHRVEKLGRHGDLLPEQRDVLVAELQARSPSAGVMRELKRKRRIQQLRGDISV